jgi:hypothetical protein
LSATERDNEQKKQENSNKVKEDIVNGIKDYFESRNELKFFQLCYFSYIFRITLLITAFCIWNIFRFDKVNLAETYQKVHDELDDLKKRQTKAKKELSTKLKILRKDFDEWRHNEIPTKFNSKANNPKESDDDSQHFNFEKSNSNSKALKEEKEEKDESANAILRKLRKELPQIAVGEEVLARWPDDGWYYRSIVKEYENEEDYRYKIEDYLKDVISVYREDIISVEDNNSEQYDSFQIGDACVALHPDYGSSYAPGQVLQISNKAAKLKIKFYDHVEAVIDRQEVFKINIAKYLLDVKSIVDLEKRWVGETVVARNDLSHNYERGECQALVFAIRVELLPKHYLFFQNNRII